ncbi:MAG: DUF2905 domain-containing protein [Desulfurobacteriaceae bacterium]
MEEVGKLLIYAGIFMILVGGLIVFLSKLGGSVPFGRLPGDIYIKRDNFVFYFPLGTSLLLSLILTLLSFLFFVIVRKQ